MTTPTDPVPRPSSGAHVRPTVIAVDDEKFILSSLKRELRGEPFELLVANSGAEGLELIRRCEAEGRAPAVVISDYKMPVMDGIEFLENVKQGWPRTQRVLLTAYASTRLLESAINRGEIHRFLNKPWERTQLKSVLISSCEQFRLLGENRRLLEERARQAERLEEQNEQLLELNSQLREWNENLEGLVDKRARQLNLAKQELAITFDAIEHPVVMIDANFAVRRANVALAEHSKVNVTELKGRRCYELVVGGSAPCEGCPVPAARDAGHARESQITLHRRDVTFAVTCWPCAPPGPNPDQAERFVCQYRDITHDERRQRKLLQSQKMAALGELAGAVAHEINNPLGGILAFAQIMQREVDKADEKHQFLECIEESAKRCQFTVRNLLNYARFTPHEERHLAELTTVVDKAIKICGHKIQLHNVELAMTIDPPESGALVRINSNEVQGVFINLIQNAMDAMETKGDTIEIHIGIDDTVEPAVQIVRVCDNGSGIPPDLIEKVFDPFFTTKDEGKGTGLGLSISYQIVRDNEGTIEIESVAGEGACFTVSFPIADWR